MNKRSVRLLGENGVRGAYLLRLSLPIPLSLAFGRFAGGRLFRLAAGDYLYVGSAMGQRGATTLAGRLLRHATRSGGRPPQEIRTDLFAQLQQLETKRSLPLMKRCQWHIDYLLDEPAVTLTQVYVLCTGNVVEGAIARWLMAETVTAVVAPGLGASDDRGATHLLQVTADKAWWERLPAVLAQWAEESNS